MDLIENHEYTDIFIIFFIRLHESLTDLCPGVPLLFLKRWWCRTECNKDDITGVPPVYGVVVRGVSRLLLNKLLDRVYHSLQRLNPRRQLQIYY